MLRNARGMKIAVPVVDGRISPLFDVAERFLLVNVETIRKGK
jgi:predicted Fe-Mo cluster-binding NifX family protein